MAGVCVPDSRPRDAILPGADRHRLTCADGPRPAPVLPTAAALEGVDVRTAPDRLRAYCDALDRRVERLERKARRPSRVRVSLRIRWRGRKPVARVKQLERGLLDAGYRIAVLGHRIALLEDAEVRA